MMSCRLPLGEKRGIPNPDCEILLMYDDHMLVQVPFKRDEALMKDWLAMGDRALEKLRSFEIKPEEMQTKVQEK